MNPPVQFHNYNTPKQLTSDADSSGHTHGHTPAGRAPAAEALPPDILALAERLANLPPEARAALAAVLSVTVPTQAPTTPTQDAIPPALEFDSERTAPTGGAGPGARSSPIECPPGRKPAYHRGGVDHPTVRFEAKFTNKRKERQS